MSFAFAELLPPNCVEQCVFDDFAINGSNAELVIDLFQWAGWINANPIGLRPSAALVNASPRRRRTPRTGKHPY
jgi:hypothetical protein